eukprot:TRINITY_DN2491_c0_g1_i2.p2 TRINITY_DN2491_c0_g1~~TRINITY_DN2491_c0_g1_i2.p2  ORF type:complete len:190 (-),score=23.28 TRINITY_DN2491_c0_g1_i2:1021-1590(-)
MPRPHHFGFFSFYYCFFFFFVVVLILKDVACEAKSIDNSIDIRVVNEVESAPNSPPYPVIAPAFVDPNATVQGSTAVVWYDSTRELLRVDSRYALLGVSQNLTTILTADSGYDIVNGVCRSSTLVFFNFFSWLPLSTYNGMVYIPGVGYCDQWIYQTELGDFTLDTIGDTPVFFSFPISADSPGQPVLR